MGGQLLFFLKFERAGAAKTQLQFFVKAHDRFGKSFAVKPPFSPWWVVTRCPRNVEHIVNSNFANYPKGPFVLRKMSELLGGGIFNADGHDWLHQRKIASKMFTAKLFKEHIWIVVQRNSRKLRDVLLSQEKGRSVDVFNLMNRFTLDTIGEIGFGKCIGSLEDPSSPFLRSFDRAQQIIFHRFCVPFWRVLRFSRTGSERETKRHLDLLDQYSRGVVRELRRSLAKEGTSKTGVVWADMEARKSFVGLFLEDATKRNEELSEDYLRDLVLNFLIAGRDTTAQALSWSIYSLCKNPTAAAMARQEIDEVCGVRGLAYEDIGRLPYLQAVLNETLRLYPSVPMDIKTAAEDDTWPDGTFVSRGTPVIYNIFAMGRDPSIWGEDACVFRPERWLEQKLAPDNYTYPVFNAGPRECLGRRLAQVEMKACLAALLPHVRFQLAVPDEQITVDAQLTIGMGQGLPCFVVNAGERHNIESGSSTAAQSEGTCAVSEMPSTAPSDSLECETFADERNVHVNTPEA